MARRRHLLILAAAVWAGVLTPGMAASATQVSHCSTTAVMSGVCSSGSLVDGGASVGATTGGGSDSDDPAWVPPPGWFRCGADWLPPERRQLAVCRDVITVTGPPTPTLADVREFYPTAAAITSEPQGWALMGRPFNLIGPSTPIVRTGLVLNLPTEVTFTPIAWQWDYGDGSAATTRTGGASWQRLGQPRLTATSTSHVYTARGDVTVTLTVDYTVSYRFDGGPSRPIGGTLALPADSLPVKVVTGSTVLTDRPCDGPTRRSC